MLRTYDPASYAEQQRETYYGVHTYNAMCGKQVTIGPAMVRCQNCAWSDGRNDRYHPGGWFSTTAVNWWIWTHAYHPATLVQAQQSASRDAGFTGTGHGCVTHALHSYIKAPTI